MAKQNIAALRQRMQSGNSGLTPGQEAARKAVATRQANQGKTVASAASDEAPADLAVQVAEMPDGFAVRLWSGKPLPVGYGWEVTSTLVDGQLAGQDTVQITLENVSAVDLIRAAEEVGGLQAAMDQDREESEDSALPRVVAAIRSHYQAKRVLLIKSDGTSAGEIGGGQIYIALYRMVEAFLQRATKQQQQNAA